MSTLHDRLADLADLADASHPGPPAPDLWGRGRRYGRRRRAGGVALTLAAVVALVAGVLAWQPVRAEVQPAQSDGLRLPDRLYHPDPWAPDIEGNGPIGPLVAVLGAPRDGWGNLDLTEESDVAGVNADGDYVFLGLDDRVGDVVELSPDGRYVAYWYGASGTDPTGDGVADGIAVLDAVEGRVRRHRIDSPLGLMPAELSWAGPRLWVPSWPYDELTASTASSRLDTTLVWDQADAEPREVDAAGLGAVGGLPALGDDLVDVRRRHLVLVGPDGSRRTLERLEGELDDHAYLDPGGTRVASLRALAPEERSDDEQLVVGTRGADPGDRVRLQPVPGVLVRQVLGWRSDHEVVTLRYTGDGAVYEAVDVTTGERTVLVRPPEQTWGSGVRIAAAALSAPVLSAPAPPDLVDPRLVAVGGLGVAGVLLVGGALLRRRRVRA